ncbi:hypothetical protein GAPWKB11_1836 [Gilliamella apicola]|nr:hypothetical protein GAPWKB11_1836 [Gilliamella apicola]
MYEGSGFNKNSIPDRFEYCQFSIVKGAVRKFNKLHPTSKNNVTINKIRDI